jgi:hypothetical protein
MSPGGAAVGGVQNGSSITDRGPSIGVNEGHRVETPGRPTRLGRPGDAAIARAQDGSQIPDRGGCHAVGEGNGRQELRWGDGLTSPGSAGIGGAQNVSRAAHRNPVVDIDEADRAKIWHCSCNLAYPCRTAIGEFLVVDDFAVLAMDSAHQQVDPWITLMLLKVDLSQPAGDSVSMLLGQSDIRITQKVYGKAIRQSVGWGGWQVHSEGWFSRTFAACQTSKQRILGRMWQCLESSASGQ